MCRFIARAAVIVACGCFVVVVRVQWVHPVSGHGGLHVKRAKGAVDRAGRAVVAAALHHSGTVPFARRAANALAGIGVDSSSELHMQRCKPAPWLVEAWDCGR